MLCPVSIIHLKLSFTEFLFRRMNFRLQAFQSSLATCYMNKIAMLICFCFSLIASNIHMLRF